MDLPTNLYRYSRYLFTPKSQRVGDILAGTILIDYRTNPNINDTIFTEVESTYKLSAIREGDAIER